MGVAEADHLSGKVEVEGGKKMKKTFTILLILVALASCSSVPEIVSGKGAVYGTISADSHKDIIAKASKGKDGIYGKNGKVIFTDKMVNYHNLKELFVCLLDPSFPGGNDHSLIATNENMSYRSMAIATGHDRRQYWVRKES